MAQAQKKMTTSEKAALQLLKKLQQATRLCRKLADIQDRGLDTTQFAPLYGRRLQVLSELVHSTLPVALVD